MANGIVAFLSRAPVINIARRATSNPLVPSRLPIGSIDVDRR